MYILYFSVSYSVSNNNTFTCVHVCMCMRLCVAFKSTSIYMAAYIEFLETVQV